VITGVVLAAGTSSRMGRPKQLLDLGGKPILQHVLDAAESSPLDEVVVVLGHRAEEIRDALRLPSNARTVLNREFAGGQSTSLGAGLRSASPASLAAVVLLGDAPRIRPGAVRSVIDAFRRGQGPVVQATYGGRPSHPVLIPRSVWAELEGSTGDEGARSLLAREPGLVERIEVGGEPPEDVDTEQDYRRLRAAMERA
jgi:molybdenum cofactor cytidylyltransferase